MKRTLVLTTIFVIAVIIFVVAASTDSVAAATTDASDTFGRSLTSSWGNADIGGPYTLSGAAANFGVNGATGNVAVPAAGNADAATLENVSALAVDISFKVATNKVATGNGQFADVVARRVSSGTEYRGRMTFGSKGVVRLRAVRFLSSKETTLGGQVTVSGLIYKANSFVWLRAQVTGANPTMIRLKAWSDGQSEPATWQYTVTDSTSALQSSGAVGLRAGLSSNTTNAPVQFSYGNLLVSNIDAATATPAASVTPTTTPTVSATTTATLSPTATATTAFSPSSTTTPTLSPTATATTAFSPSSTTTPTLSPTATATTAISPTSTATATLSPTATATPISPTSTATLTLSPTATSTAAISSTATATLSPAVTAYISDTFSRSLTGSWGNADIGGPYTLSGTAANFNVNGSAGTIAIPTGGATLSAYLFGVSALNVDINARITSDKLPTGGSQYALVVARHVSSGDEYRGQVTFGTNGTVSIVAVNYVSGAATILGSAVRVPNLTYAANEYVRLHMQVVGTNPTQIRMKAWADGQPEPAAWQYSATDSTLELQTAGIVALRAILGSATSNAPVVFSFDDFVVTDGTAFITAPTPTPAVTPTAIPMNAPSVYWGALLYGKPPDASNFQTGGLYDNFETNIAKKKLAIIHWGAPWEYPQGTMLPFETTYMNNVRNHGSIPMLTWGSWASCCGPNQPKYQLSNITRGDFDAFITQWATDAKNWGHPFFLRFDWEMNGNWSYPWSVQLNGNTPSDFVQAWRHVHDVFTHTGATNVTWVWCPNISGTTTTPMSQVYPGDAYVDWSCLDGYNQYSSWLGFNTVFTGSGTNWLYDSYQEILQVAPTKPIVIGETASLEAGDGGTKKSAWITDAYQTQLPQNFPRVKAIVWFNWDAGDPTKTFPIESSQASTNAFSAAIGYGFYPANNFGNLSASPIPPLTP